MVLKQCNNPKFLLLYNCLTFRLLQLGALIFCFASTEAASAQVVYEGCVDFRGIPVPSIADTTSLQIALAGVTRDGYPVIIYNPYGLPQLHPETRLFAYAHECAHHYLGHVLLGTPTYIQESEADCWAITELVNNGLITEDGVRIIQFDIARLGQADWSHFSGPQRAINLTACLGW